MKRYLPIVIIFFGIVGIVVGVVLSTGASSQPSTQGGPTPAPYSKNSFRGINPNTATAGSVVSIMGPPIRTDAGKNQNTLIYASGVGNRPININIDAGSRVTSIIEPVQMGTKFGPLYALLGKEDVVLYGNYFYSGYYLYTYLTLGTALLANPKTDDIKQRWYFPQRDIAAFLKEAGAGFQTSPLPSGRE